MNDIIRFDLADIIPDQTSIFDNLGYTKGSKSPEKILDLFSDARDIFTKSVRAVALVQHTGQQEFGEIYEGTGQNEPDSPLAQIYPRADHLAIFALSLGEAISGKIEDLFRNSDYALGYVLDTIASLAADRASEVLEKLYYEYLLELQYDNKDTCVLSYSPGYCGWHISGQKKLFQHLVPEKIDIYLNDSFLMTPLKSVSGVLVAGKKDIHMFSSTFPFCQYCKTYSCHHRMQRLYS